MTHQAWYAVFLSVGGMAMLGKIFLIFARTMPPPPADCKFWCRWFHDFIQGLAENQDKIGQVQDPDKPTGQARQTLTSSASTVEVPAEVVAVSAVPVAQVVGKP